MVELLKYFLYFARTTVVEVGILAMALTLVYLCASSWLTSREDRALLDRNGGDGYAHRQAAQALRAALGRGVIAAIFAFLAATSMFAEPRIPPSFSSVAGLILMTVVLIILSALQIAERRDRALNIADIMALRRARESNAAGIIALDRFSTILQFNAAAERIFGYAPDEVLGRSMLDLIPARFRDAHLRGIARAYASEEPSARIGPVLDLPGVRKDGTEVSLRIVLHETRGIGGKVFVAIFTEERAGADAGPRDVGELRHDAQMAAIERGTEASKAAQREANDVNRKIAEVTEVAARKATELQNLVLDRIDKGDVRKGERDAREAARDGREEERDARVASHPTPTESMDELIHNTELTEGAKVAAEEAARQHRAEKGEPSL